MRAVPAPEARPTRNQLLSILVYFLEMSMLKKLVPAVFGAMLIASPVIGVTTAAAAAPQAAATAPAAPAKAEHHKAAKHHAMKHSMKHHMAKHHAAKKKAKKPA